MLQINGQLVLFVRITKDTWVPVRALEGATVLPLIMGVNMKDLIGTAQLDEGRVSLLIHGDLPEGVWYAVPVGSLLGVERKEKQIVAVTRYRLAAISLSQDAPEGSIPLYV